MTQGGEKIVDDVLERKSKSEGERKKQRNTANFPVAKGASTESSVYTQTHGHTHNATAYRKGVNGINKYKLARRRGAAAGAQLLAYIEIESNQGNMPGL